MTIQDARAGAMIGAFERIKAAQKLLLDYNKQPVEKIPERYWALIAEAGVLAELAKADLSTGITAGLYLDEQEQRIQKNRDRAAEFMAARG